MTAAQTCFYNHDNTVFILQRFLGAPKYLLWLKRFFVWTLPSSWKRNWYIFCPRCHWLFQPLRVRAFFHKTVRVCHVYCNFKIGFTCRIIVIFGTLKDGSLLIYTLASNICFSYRNIFQNGVDALPKIVDAFLSKSSNFHLVQIIR